VRLEEDPDPAGRADWRLRLFEMNRWEGPVIRKLKGGQYRLYSKKKDPKTGRRKNLGTFKSLAAAQKHERAVQYFKRH